jgi:hypothetical protein
MSGCISERTAIFPLTRINFMVEYIIEKVDDRGFHRFISKHTTYEEAIAAYRKIEPCKYLRKRLLKVEVIEQVS